jgi:ribonucleoside-diphosphate reductase alpha chain
MQAAAQKYIDSSVSKTINGPHMQSVEDVKRAYRLAYENGLKGLAYFRDGSGRDQVLYRNDPAPDKSSQEEVEALKRQISLLETKAIEDQVTVWGRPDVLSGRTMKVQTKNEAAYVTVNRDSDGVPREVFINIGKSGDDLTAMAEALGRLISLALRKGATLGGVANQLEGIGGMTNLMWQKSIPHAVGQALTEENKREEEVRQWAAETAAYVFPDEAGEESVDTGTDFSPGLQCPACKEFALVLEEGCKKCYSCSYSAC